MELLSPPTSFSDNVLDAADDIEREDRFRTLQNVLDFSPADDPDEELHFLAAEEPASFSEAEQEANWR